MSHDATNWAIKQRGLKPAVKIVLWNLCDRYHPDHGCFPSQETLADDCELPRSTLNVYLNELETAGLIRREQRRDGKSRRQESTLYRFAFERGFEANATAKPSPDSGHGKDGAESRNRGEPSPENGESRVQILDTNPVIEPVREPLSAQAREGEGLARADRKRIERDFVAWYAAWDKGDVEFARNAWFAMPAEDRAECIERSPDVIRWTKASERAAAAVYLKNRQWRDMPQIPPPEERTTSHNAYTKAWSAKRLFGLLADAAEPPVAPTLYQMAELRKGGEAAEKVLRERRLAYGWPKVNSMHRRAEMGEGSTVEPWIVRISSAFVGLHKDSQEVARWKAYHSERGWPWLPVPEGVDWLFFPAGDPEHAVAEFKQAANEGRDDDAA